MSNPPWPPPPNEPQPPAGEGPTIYGRPTGGQPDYGQPSYPPVYGQDTSGQPPQTDPTRQGFPPGQGPYGPPPGQPPYGQQPPYNPQPSYGQPLQGPGAPHRRSGGGGNGMLIGFVALAVLLFGGLAVGGIVWFNSKDDDSKNTASESKDEPTKEATEDPTDEPTEDPTDEPTDEPTEDPTTEAPTEAPTTEAPPAPPEKVTAAEYQDDWKAGLGDKKYHATQRNAWDRSCRSIAADQHLKNWGCKYAVEANYQALGGKLRMTQMILVMSSSAKATTAANKMKDTYIKWNPGTWVPGYTQGRWRSQSAGQYVVVTVCSGKGLSQAKVDDYVDASNADFVGVFLFR